jgi:hypothetical protein
VLTGYIDFLQVTDAGEECITCAGGETIIIPINAPSIPNSDGNAYPIAKHIDAASPGVFRHHRG